MGFDQGKPRMSAATDTGHIPITHWYVDTRSLHPETRRAEVPLPLLSSVSVSDQAKITRFVQAKDKLMSLASTLLKYLFIHRTAQIPWSEVTISRWPAPHKRPYWSPTPSWPGTFGLEFNVSHQAGLIALIGCKTPERDSSSQPDLHLDVLHSDTRHNESNVVSRPRLGVDITCTSESHRGPKQITTSAGFAKWVDIFTEMFSSRERDEMQHSPIPTTISDSQTEEAKTLAKLRRFYTYWSLKEAYIKMVGEGLLASWLRELEFSDVVPPSVPDQENEWGPTFNSATINNPASFKILLQRQPVQGVSMTVSSYGSTFIVATAMNEATSTPANPEPEWRLLDIEQDIRPCAEGRCRCLVLS